MRLSTLLAAVFGALGGAWGYHVADRLGLVVGVVVCGAGGRALGSLLVAAAEPDEWDRALYDEFDSEWSPR